MSDLASSDGEQILAELKRFNRREASWAQPKQISLTLLTQVELEEIPATKTSRCLPSPPWGRRNTEFDLRLPLDLPSEPKCDVTAYRLARQMTLKEMARVVLDAPTETSVGHLSRLFKERGLLLSLSQVDRLVELCERGVDVGLRTNGWDNYAFLEDSNGVVRAIIFGRYFDTWHGFLYPLHDERTLGGARRLLLRNMSAAAL